MADYNQLSDGRPAGVVMGINSSDLVGFYNTAPVAQASAITTQSINALSVSGVVGFTSSTSLSSVVEKLNSVLTALRNLGLIAS